MTAVVDSSVIVAALIETGRVGVWAETVLAEGDLFGPGLVLVESSNVLRRLERAEQISRLEAALANADLMRLDIELVPYAPFAERVWALRANLTCYDAWYVASAEALSCPFYTLDRRLTRALGPPCEVIAPQDS